MSRSEVLTNRLNHAVAAISEAYHQEVASNLSLEATVHKLCKTMETCPRCRLALPGVAHAQEDPHG